MHWGDSLAGSPEVVAPQLLGSSLVSELGGSTVKVRITEVEAYKGSDDPASHAFRGRTRRNGSMFERPGTLYVYRSYGIHWCANVAAGPEGVGWGILFRGGEVVEGIGAARLRRGREDELANGPGKLAQALGIEHSLNGSYLLDQTSPLRLEPGPPPDLVMATPRVGVSQARERPWRFVAVTGATTPTRGGRHAAFTLLPTMSPDEQLPLLLRYADQVVPEEDLGEKLEQGRPLRVKLGLDPTAPSVTLGWAVVLRKLRQFQELGHIAVLIVGDFTAQVGDPSERAETRRRLTAEEVNGYAENVLGQFRKILLPENLEIRRNSEWLASLDMPGLLELTSVATVAQMLERSDFANRYRDGTPISVMEFLYPLLQGYDSVAVEADIELGGSDQLWNLMMGRLVQERYEMPPQVAMTMPILVGVDGIRRMGQSLGNYIGVEEDPDEMFGKTMSIPDEAMAQWFRLAADLEPDEADRIEAGLASGDLHPGETKRHLARAVTALYWGEAAAAAAEQGFDRVFKSGGIPDDIDSFSLPEEDPITVPGLIRDVFGLSGSEARRLLTQGAVKVDGEVLEAQEAARAALVGRVLQVGKRRFVRLVDELD